MSERVGSQDNTCIVCGNESGKTIIITTTTTTMAMAIMTATICKDAISFCANSINLSLNPDGNLNNPNNGEQLQANIIELLRMGINFPNDVFNDGVGQSANSVSKNT